MGELDDKPNQVEATYRSYPLFQDSARKRSNVSIY